MPLPRSAVLSGALLRRRRVRSLSAGLASFLGCALALAVVVPLLAGCPVDDAGAADGAGEGGEGEGEGEELGALGDACTDDAQCARGLCGFEGASDDRVCVANECGASSTGGAGACTDGLVCQDEGPCGSTCTALGAVDDVCLSNLERDECAYERACAAGLVCTEVPAGKDQLARCFEPARFPVGAPCTDDGACESGVCALDAAGQSLCRGDDCPSGSACGEGLVCAVLFDCGTECRPPAAEGALCGTEADAACQLVDHGCEAGLECRGTTNGDTSSCVEPVGAGGRCNIDVPERDGCQDGLTCVATRCQ